MIFTERTIKISKDTCEIDKPIVLYRGDYNVEVRFTIIESPFKYTTKNSSNIIEDVKASYGQLVIKTPNEKPPIFTDVVETNEGSIVFTLSGEMIDESVEVGDYTFQIRLFDSNRGSRATIPPIENGISIREPIAIEDVSTTDKVDVATVGYALTTAGTPEDAFNSEGNYNKTTWGTGDRITAAKLNKIEAGIDGVNKKVASGGTGGTVDLSGYVTKETGNASQITFADGQTFQAKLDAGTLKGEKGDQGERGEQGLQGIKGDKGDKGEPGLQGIQGEKGDRGEQGIQGLKGDKGDKGDTGANGQDGLTTSIIVNSHTYNHVDGTITLPDYPTVPTNISTFTNDAHYTTEQYVDDVVHNASISGGYTHPATHPASMITGLSTVATSGSYNDLTDKPIIPTRTSELANNSDFVDSAFVSRKIAEASLSGGEVDLSGYVTKEVGNASQIQFADGQTFQDKLDAGTLKGDKGDQGEQGPQGPKGSTGGRGPRGDQGEQGLQGPKGDTGAKGQDGLTTNIVVNGNTYTHSNGTITLPNYPTVPTKTSQLTNDSDYVTTTEMTDAINNASLGGSTGGTNNINDEIVSTTTTYSSNKINSQFASKDEVFTMANMGQDIKDKIDNKIIDKQHTTFIKINTNINLYTGLKLENKRIGGNTSTGIRIESATDSDVYIVPVEPNKTYSVIVKDTDLVYNNNKYIKVLTSSDLVASDFTGTIAHSEYMRTSNGQLNATITTGENVHYMYLYLFTKNFAEENKVFQVVEGTQTSLTIENMDDCYEFTGISTYPKHKLYTKDKLDLMLSGVPVGNIFIKNGEICNITLQGKSGYIFKHNIVSSKNIDTWMLTRGTVNDVVLWNGTDIEAPIKEVGAADFIGGIHGDEVFESISVICDGVLIDMSQDYNLSFKNLTIFVKSTLYRCDTTTPVFTRYKKLEFTNNELIISNRLICLVDNFLVERYTGCGLYSAYKDVIIGYTVNTRPELITDGGTGHDANMDIGTFFGNGFTVTLKTLSGKTEDYKGSVANFSSEAKPRYKLYFDSIKSSTGHQLNTNDELNASFSIKID